MAEMSAASQIQTHYYRDLTAVPIAHMRGNDGRRQDYERRFNPRKRPQSGSLAKYGPGLGAGHNTAARVGDLPASR